MKRLAAALMILALLGQAEHVCGPECSGRQEVSSVQVPVTPTGCSCCGDNKPSTPESGTESDACDCVVCEMADVPAAVTPEYNTFKLSCAACAACVLDSAMQPRQCRSRTGKAVVLPPGTPAYLSLAVLLI